MARSLYICYFGVREPLVQTQVIPYLRELVKGGHELTLLTFEPGDVDDEAVREELAGQGIEWHWLRYHKRPSVPATLFDIANGARHIRALMKRKPFDILHARSHVPMMMATLARKLSSHKPKLLFDIRGFMPEEYVDAGVWSETGSIYRNFKGIETRLMNEANGFVVLAEAARNVLFPESRETGFDTASRPVEVIPCCVDFERRFSGDPATERSAIRAELNIEARCVFTHIGALGGLYLTEQMADFLETARERDPKTFALFLTQSDPKLISQPLIERGFAESDFFVGKVGADKISGYLHASDVGLSFVKSTFATKSRSPTKIPEYLACGLPVIANAGVGDVDSVLQTGRTGVILYEFSRTGYTLALDQLDALMSGTALLAEKCRSSAHRRFDLATIGGESYRRLYLRLSGPEG